MRRNSLYVWVALALLLPAGTWAAPPEADTPTPTKAVPPDTKPPASPTFTPTKAVPPDTKPPVATATATNPPDTKPPVPTATATNPPDTKAPSATATNPPQTATATATATATVAAQPPGFQITMAVLDRGRDRSSNENGRVTVRARINDSGSLVDLPTRLVAGGFELEVSDADGSFHVSFPIDSCALRSNGDAQCRTKGAINSRVRLMAGDGPGQWFLRAQAFGFTNSETGPVGVVNSTDAPVTVTLSDGSSDTSSIISTCRKTGATKLICRGEGQAPPVPTATTAPTATAVPSAVDCVVSDWSAFTTCSESCDGGTQERTRTVITPAAFGGNACPTLTDTQSCNQQPCAVDCVVSDWSSYSSCSASCGGGTQGRTRTVITPAAFGGNACPTLTDTQSCNQQPCAVDCVVSAWGPYSSCSASCGGGTQSRTRTVTMPAAFGGNACPSLTDTQSCNQEPCPVDCVVTPWSDWGTCSAACGGGTRTRTRSVAASPQFGGTSCPALSEMQACNTDPCA